MEGGKETRKQINKRRGRQERQETRKEGKGRKSEERKTSR